MVLQRHHVIYKDTKNKKEVVRTVRKGVHAAITLLRRFNYLTTEEVNAVMLECMLKQRFKDE